MIISDPVTSSQWFVLKDVLQQGPGATPNEEWGGKLESTTAPQNKQRCKRKKSQNKNKKKRFCSKYGLCKTHAFYQNVQQITFFLTWNMKENTCELIRTEGCGAVWCGERNSFHCLAHIRWTKTHIKDWNMKQSRDKWLWLTTCHVSALQIWI